MSTVERIKEFLERKNWSTYRLSKESGISLSTLSNLVYRNHEPSLYTLSKICDALEITLLQFFDYEGCCYSEMLNNEQKQILEEWINLSKEQKEKVKIFIAGIRS